MSEMRTLDEKLSELASTVRSSEAKSQETQAEGDAMKRELDQLRAELDQTTAHARQLEAHKKDKLSKFGTNITQVLQDIDRHQWAGVKPLGPLGLYVDLKDKLYADLMRSNLGNQMTAFAISHDQDRGPLKKILNGHGK